MEGLYGVTFTATLPTYSIKSISQDQFQGYRGTSDKGTE